MSKEKRTPVVQSFAVSGTRRTRESEGILEESYPLEYQTDGSLARNQLIPLAALQKFLATNQFTENALRHFAKEIGIAPRIVVGRLQHDRTIGRNIGNSLKIRYQAGGYAGGDR